MPNAVSPKGDFGQLCTAKSPLGDIGVSNSLGFIMKLK